MNRHPFFGGIFFGASPPGEVVVGNQFHTLTTNGRLPDLLVEVDFVNDPTSSTRTWTDVTTDVRAISYTRGGRDNELQRTAAGSLTMVLDNRDGDYDPTNTGGAHYPGVKRMRWVRVRARWNGVVYSRWQGLVESWRQEWPGSGADAVVTVQAADAFKVLNLYDLDGQVFPAERTDQRVTDVLAAASVEAVNVSVGASNVVTSGTFSEGSSALSHLLQVEETENGLLFANEQGAVEFQDRHYRLSNSTDSRGTIGDAAGEIPYRTGELDLNDEDIWNEVSVTPSGGTAQTASDTASQAAHFTRRLNRSSLSDDTSEAASAASFLLNLYADSAPRIPAVELLGAGGTAFWPTILTARNSDRFTWIRRADSHTITTGVYVEKVSDQITPGREWQVQLELSPVPAGADRWFLGTNLLGQTTEVAY